jgi:predicted RNA polymerase sigma factor
MAAYERALALTTHPIESAYLRRRRDALAQNISPAPVDFAK